MKRGNIFRFISHDVLFFPASVGPSFATGIAKYITGSGPTQRHLVAVVLLVAVMIEEAAA
jgi:hypothetical protein